MVSRARSLFTDTSPSVLPYLAPTKGLICNKAAESPRVPVWYLDRPSFAPCVTGQHLPGGSERQHHQPRAARQRWPILGGLSARLPHHGGS